MTKNAEQDWLDGWDKQLEIAEKKEIAIIKRYYKQQYGKAIEIYKQTKQTSNFQTVFKLNDYGDLFANMYERIGFRFADYFRKSYSLLFKQLDTSNYDDLWRQIFNQLGGNIGQKIASDLKSTTDKTLKKEFSKFLNDPDLVKLNEREAARIITSRFANIAEYQAARIVRTEATYIANIGTQQSAKDTFGKNELIKKWKTSSDERVRNSHVILNNIEKDYDDLFQGIMLVPGDRLNGATAKDVVNCRCRIIYKPKPGIVEAEKLTPQTARQVQGILTDFT